MSGVNQALSIHQILFLQELSRISPSSSDELSLIKSLLDLLASEIEKEKHILNVSAEPNNLVLHPS